MPGLTLLRGRRMMHTPSFASRRCRFCRRSSDGLKGLVDQQGRLAYVRSLGSREGDGMLVAEIAQACGSGWNPLGVHHVKKQDD